MKTPVSDHVAERLYADDWRVESTIHLGPRIVKDCGSVYATIVPTSYDYGWNVWEWTTGQHLHGGRDEDITAAAQAALTWVNEEWLGSE
jgi:hypothetical protein